MKAYDVPSVIIKWIANWLSGRRQRVVLEGKVSPWEPVKSGVIQGSQIGPTLFLLFLSDLSINIDPSVFLSSYADDSKLLGLANENDNTLQSSLNELGKWCIRNCMEFNISKCKVVHFGHDNPGKKYYIYGEKLESTDSIKDLGVIVDQKLKFSEHILKISKRANSLLGQIRRCFSYRKKEAFLSLYKTFVRSQLEHAVQLWNPWMKKDIDLLEKVQKRALKQITGLSGTYEEKLKQIEIPTLENRRQRGDLIQTFKIIRNIDDVNYKNWFRFTSEVNIRDSRSVSEARLEIPFARLDIRKYFFSVRVPKLWNEIPNSTRQNVCTTQFKIGYDEFVENVNQGMTYYVL